MNSEAISQPGSESNVHAAPHAEIGFARRFRWCVQRELWEYRWLYLAPLAVAALILVGYTFGLVHLPEKLRAAAALDPMKQRQLVEQPFTFAALLLMFTTFLLGMFYSLDALHGERRDRSILFWKSLPVSDLTTVLAKASIPMVGLPLLTYVVTQATQIVMLLMASVRLAGTGLSVWAHIPFGEMSWTLFHHLVVGHGFWYAPIWGWLLLCSAWSRRAPYLWATLPLLAIALVERIAFNTTLFGHWLAYRFMGGPAGASSSKDPMTMAGMTPPLLTVLTDAGFWFGVALAAAFLFAAARLRRSRGPN